MKKADEKSIGSEKGGVGEGMGLEHQLGRERKGRKARRSGKGHGAVRVDRERLDAGGGRDIGAAGLPLALSEAGKPRQVLP
jgi:hypothetical protein